MGGGVYHFWEKKIIIYKKIQSQMFQIKINLHNIHDEHPLLILKAIINSNFRWAMWEIDFLGGGGLPYGGHTF